MKNNNKCLYIIFALIIIVVLSILMYYKFFSSVSSTDDHIDNNTVISDDEDISSEEISISSKQIQELYRIIDFDMLFPNSGLYSQKMNLVSELSDDDKTELLRYLLVNSSEYVAIKNENGLYTYTSDVVKEAWSKIFGNDSPVLTNKVNLGYNSCVTYNEDGSITDGPCGGGYGPYDIGYKILKKAVMQDGDINLYVLVKFIDDEPNNNNYYSDYERTKVIKNESTEPANYKFIFKKDSKDNYYFYGVEKI